MPRAEGSGASTTAKPSKDASHKLSYERQSSGWEAFRCACGKSVQLSPAFHAKTVRCRGCRREIEIVSRNGVTAATP